jgi:hypothetical protein
MSLQPEFPAPIRFGGRLRFDQHEHENYKRALAGLPAVERARAEPIRFVDASAVCADLAIDRRTLGRRVKGRVREETYEPASDFDSDRHLEAAVGRAAR